MTEKVLSSAQIALMMIFAIGENLVKSLSPHFPNDYDDRRINDDDHPKKSRRKFEQGRRFRSVKVFPIEPKLSEAHENLSDFEKSVINDCSCFLCIF